jgi:hypothetical protein
VHANTEIARIERIRSTPTLTLVSPRDRERDITAEFERDQRRPLGEALNDESIVEFEGERVRWSDLLLQDRKAYLHGGWAF